MGLNTYNDWSQRLLITISDVRDKTDTTAMLSERPLSLDQNLKNRIKKSKSGLVVYRGDCEDQFGNQDKISRYFPFKCTNDTYLGCYLTVPDIIEDVCIQDISHCDIGTTYLVPDVRYVC
jgi:hypothetical protein